MVHVTKKALQELIQQAMDTILPLDSTDIINVNPVVDPVASETQPENANFVPQNVQELDIAVRSLISVIGDADAPGAYAAVKNALATLEKDNIKNMAQDRVEEMLRKHIRQILKEENLDVAQTADKTNGDTSFERIAASVQGPDGKPFSVSGAKQLVDKAMKRYKFLFDMLDEDEDEFEIFVLESVREYIAFLAKSGELTSADIKLMKDHPGAVADLEGFREFIHKRIERSRLGKDDEMDDDLDVSSDVGAEPVSNESDPDFAEFQRLHAMYGDKAPGAAGTAPPNSDGKAYKIYKTKHGLVIRINKNGGKGLYKAGPGTKFNPNDRPYAAPGADGSRLIVKNPEDGHTQEWEFTNEAADAGAPPLPSDPSADPEYARYLALYSKFGAVAKTKKVRQPREPKVVAPVDPDGKGYKVYKTKHGAVIRYKKQLYKGPPGSRFSPNETPKVSMNGDRLRVKNAADGHTQEWEPMEEAEIHDLGACGKPVGKTNDGKQITCSAKKGHTGPCKVG